MKVQGSCHCGQVTYEAEVDPEKVSLWNCTDCQMLTGSAFRVLVPAPAAHVSIVDRAAKGLRQDRGQWNEA
jgi:hypothetical protein